MSGKQFGDLFRGSALVGFNLKDRHLGTTHAARQFFLSQVKCFPPLLEPLTKRPFRAHSKPTRRPPEGIQ
jgi:hypothetical protein